LISLAKEVVAAAARGANFTPPLDEDQLAFYDAVATNESAVDVMGEGVLADIAREFRARATRQQHPTAPKPRQVTGSLLAATTAGSPHRLPIG
jgi:hypothetical protein